MTPEQEKIYAANLLKVRGELDMFLEVDNFNKNSIKILSQLTRLRQICCHPLLCIDNYKGDSGKLSVTMDIIVELISSGHRILLFSQFTSMLDIIKRELLNKNISYLYLDGGTKAKERSLITENFNNGEGHIFLISLRAGGTGLNLTGADVVIHYDQWWNPAVMDQASDRAYRYGQKKSVQIISIVTKNSLEEKVLELQNKKKELTNSVITQGTKFITSMSKEEILTLFE